MHFSAISIVFLSTEHYSLYDISSAVVQCNL